MAELLCSTDVVSYSEVKKIDARLQAFAPSGGASPFSAPFTLPLKGIFEGTVQAEWGPITTVYIKQTGTSQGQRFTARSSNQSHDYVTAINILHRQFFARAMLDKRLSPFDGPYAMSVEATYRSSIALLNALAMAARALKGDLGRTRNAWAPCLLCAVSSWPFSSTLFKNSDLYCTDQYWLHRLPRHSKRDDKKCSI